MRNTLFISLAAFAIAADGANLMVGSYSVPLSGAAVQIDALSGSVIAHVASNAGVPGDGWCPTGSATAQTPAAPYVELRAQNGAVHRISITARRIAGNGSIHVTPLSIGGAPGDGWCPTTGGSSVTWPVALSASPAAIAAGATTTLRWTTAAATSCSTAGSSYPAGVTSVAGWSASMPTSSSGTTLLLSTAGTYTFRLTCSPANGAASSQTATVTVGGGTSCTGLQAPPAGYTRQTAYRLDTTQLWASSNSEWAMQQQLDLTAWWPTPQQTTSAGVRRASLGVFAGTPGDTGTLTIDRFKYISLRIDVSAQHSGKYQSLNWEQPGSSGAPLTVSISPCPGDFRPVNPKCVSPTNGASGIGISVGGGVTNACPVSVGSTYYLNVIFADPLNGFASTCGFDECWWLVASECNNC